MTANLSNTQHVPLGELLRFRNEIVHPRDRPQGSETFVGLEHIERDTGIRIGKENIDLSEMTGRRARFKTGDIVYGYLRPYLNKVWVAEFDGICSVDQYVLTVRPDVSRNYVMHFLRSPQFLQTAPIDTAPGQLPRIRSGELSNTPIPLPPFDEQRRIAAILDKADALRQKRKRAIALLDSLTQAVFLEMFGDPQVNPRKLRTQPIGELLDVSPNFGSMNPPRPDRGDWVSLRVANIQDWALTLDDTKYIDLESHEHARFTLRHGDMILARAIASQEHLGKCVVVEPGDRKWAFDSHLMRLRLDREKLEPMYLREMFRTPGGRALFLRATRKTTVQYNINTKELSALRVPVPALASQRDFVSKIDRLQIARTANIEMLAKSAVLFSSLQHRAFSGQL